MKNIDFVVTDNAFKRIKNLITAETKQNLGLRISVDGGGCSGFRYIYDLDDKITPLDYVIEKDGTKVIIDNISSEYLNGSLIDYIEELGESYFNIKNPNASSKCGCGSSFSI